MLDRSQKRILILLGLIFITLVTIFIYMYQNREVLEKKEFVKPYFDKNMKKGAPVDLDPAWSYNRLLIQKGKTLTLCATPVVKKKILQLYLTSDPENDFWLKVRVFNEKEQALGECGLIVPGSYIKEIPLRKKVRSGEKLILHVMMYEKESYQSLGSATVGIYVL